MSDIKVGDLIAIDTKKIGQKRRTGTVRTISQGLSGARYTVAWEAGGVSTFSPGAGNLVVVGSRKKTTKVGPGKKTTKKPSKSR